MIQRVYLGLLLLLLVACSKITAENYQKISSGMSRIEVVAVLGEPSSTESASLLGIEGESAVWQNGDLQIKAQFVNQKLWSHTMVK